MYMNFGVWTHTSHPLCGADEGNTTEWCPHVDWMCDYLKKDHDFELFWATSTPETMNKVVSETIPLGHHLDLVTQCQLPESQVLNRSEVIYTLEPRPKWQHTLFWNKNHMHAEANHGFNRQLVMRLAELDEAAKGWNRFNLLNPLSPESR